MTTICLEIPEWAERRAIYVMAGIELLAYKRPNSPLMVKTGRCNMCGKCCTIRGETCEHLKPNGSQWECGFFLSRPFSCCIGLGAYRVPDCTERFEEV